VGGGSNNSVGCAVNCGLSSHQSCL